MKRVWSRRRADRQVFVWPSHDDEQHSFGLLHWDPSAAHESVGTGVLLAVGSTPYLPQVPPPPLDFLRSRSSSPAKTSPRSRRADTQVFVWPSHDDEQQSFGLLHWDPSAAHESVGAGVLLSVGCCVPSTGAKPQTPPPGLDLLRVRGGVALAAGDTTVGSTRKRSAGLAFREMKI
jgi:hypothetical protein